MLGVVVCAFNLSPGKGEIARSQWQNSQPKQHIPGPSERPTLSPKGKADIICGGGTLRLSSCLQTISHTTPLSHTQLGRLPDGKELTT